MSSERLARIFPNLRVNDTYDPTSDEDPGYNCVAFAVGVLEEWWDPYNPEGVWPEGIERDVAVKNYIALFELHGFVVCDDSIHEAGFEKIALYCDQFGDFAHVARQLPSGSWTSKLGELEDIEHRSLDAVVCPAYGRPMKFMKRPSPES